jgi:hypothetical protein
VERKPVANAVRLHFPNDFTLSLEPVIQGMTVALPAANEQVVGAKTNLVLQHRLGKPVMDNDRGVHRGHLGMGHVPANVESALSGDHLTLASMVPQVEGVLAKTHFGDRGDFLDDSSSQKAHREKKRECNRSKAVGTHDAVAGAPGEHEHIEEDHEFIRPEQAGDSERKRKLGKHTQNDIIHPFVSDGAATSPLKIKTRQTNSSRRYSDRLLGKLR